MASKALGIMRGILQNFYKKMLNLTVAENVFL